MTPQAAGAAQRSPGSVEEVTREQGEAGRIDATLLDALDVSFAYGDRTVLRGVTLSLRAAWQASDGEIVAGPRPDAAPVAQLAISDTGIGIPSTEQGKMFTRFFRASTAQKNAVPGVGLGLAITKAITTAHGGTLDLVSAEGAGTTFTLTLPRA